MIANHLLGLLALATIVVGGVAMALVFYLSRLEHSHQRWEDEMRARKLPDEDIHFKAPTDRNAERNVLLLVVSGLVIGTAIWSMLMRH